VGNPAVEAASHGSGRSGEGKGLSYEVAPSCEVKDNSAPEVTKKEEK